MKLKGSSCPKNWRELTSDANETLKGLFVNNTSICKVKSLE
jgi:hypothetical protein